MSELTWKTQNDLPAAVRVKSIGLLNQLLADVIDLGLQAKQAHWNVKGPQFIALHELFDEAGDEVEALADELAERAVQLGGTALGTVQVVALQSRLTSYPAEIHGGTEHLRALSSAFAQFGQSARASIATADEAGDADTADLFTGVSRGADKLLWKIEAHLWSQTQS